MGSSFHPPCALYRFNHLKIAEELHCGYEAAQFWRLTCAPNQRFGQVIKKSNPSEQCQQEVTFMISGAQTRNRTKDTGIFSPLLYQLSYLGILLINNIMVGHQGLEPRTCRL